MELESKSVVVLNSISSTLYISLFNLKKLILFSGIELITVLKWIWVGILFIFIGKEMVES